MAVTAFMKLSASTFWPESSSNNATCAVSGAAEVGPVQQLPKRHSEDHRRSKEGGHVSTNPESYPGVPGLIDIEFAGKSGPTGHERKGQRELFSEAFGNTEKPIPQFVFIQFEKKNKLTDPWDQFKPVGGTAPQTHAAPATLSSGLAPTGVQQIGDIIAPYLPGYANGPCGATRMGQNISNVASHLPLAAAPEHI